jgi:hypothetical protein
MRLLVALFCVLTTLFVLPIAAILEMAEGLGEWRARGDQPS